MEIDEQLLKLRFFCVRPWGDKKST